VDAFANADFVIQFLFELVNDGLNLGAGNSEGGLEFEQDGCARANEFLDGHGIAHQRGLARMQDYPCGNKGGDNHPKGKEIIPFWFVCEQNASSNDHQTDGQRKE
jgi:hypothetical protein